MTRLPTHYSEYLFFPFTIFFIYICPVAYGLNRLTWLKNAGLHDIRQDVRDRDGKNMVFFDLTLQIQIISIMVAVCVRAIGCPRSEDIVSPIRRCRFSCVENGVQ